MKKIRKNIFLIFTLLAALIFSGCSVDDLGQHKIAADQLQVHFISVGQGDSELIKLPTGQNVLIDAGDTDCRNVLIKYLKDNNVSEIDMAIATHPHSDHIGSMQAVLENFKVNNIIRPDYDYDSVLYTNFLYSIEENKVNEILSKPGYTFDEGGAHFEILGPLKEYDECNNMSVVVMMTYGAQKFLFTGDMQEAAEKDLLAAGYNLHADVLKVGHHGSETSSSVDFLKAVAPSVAVIEVGKDNDYNLPKDKIVTRLAQSGATVYRTDKSGDIVVCSDGKDYTITTDDSASDMLNGALYGNSSQQSSSSQITTQKSDEQQDNENKKSSSANKALTSAKKTEGAYVGNSSSKIYHSADCSALPTEKNRVYFSTQQEAEKAGYSPHSACVK